VICVNFIIKTLNYSEEDVHIAEWTSLFWQNCGRKTESEYKIDWLIQLYTIDNADKSHALNLSSRVINMPVSGP